MASVLLVGCLGEFNPTLEGWTDGEGTTGGESTTGLSGTSNLSTTGEMESTSSSGGGSSSSTGGEGTSGGTGGTGDTGDDTGEEPLLPGICGNGIRDLGEECDYFDLGQRSCETEGFPGGILRCLPECILDRTLCSVCGNGTIDPGEECDGSMIPGPEQTCGDVGLGGDDQPLTCTGDCRIAYGECDSCGNGTLDSPEWCDGGDLGTYTCNDFGFDGGFLSCTENCTPRTDECVRCGDGVVSPGEMCDFPDFGGLDCTDFQDFGGQPFNAGRLFCDPWCNIDPAGCSTCGDGVVTGTEACDGGNLNGFSCESLGLGPGQLFCNPDCQWFDVGGCQVCGNGIVEGDEDCDGDYPDPPVSCADVGLGGAGEQVRCERCHWEFSECASCGDGQRQDPEWCDGNDLGMFSGGCQDFGADGGTLRCGPGCQPDDSECYACGDGMRNGPENCDGADFGGLQCSDFQDGMGRNFNAGTLRCDWDCNIDLFECSFCGDGIVVGAEICDGENLFGNTCRSMGYSLGKLRCADDCRNYDFSECTQCGNGIIEGSEQCDGGNTNGETCQSRGFDGGTLGCSSDCIFDEAQCTTNTTCGDGSLQANEACDCGNDDCTALELDLQMCSNFLSPAGTPFNGGELRCNSPSSCSFDLYACTWCGNEVLEGGEDCDGGVLGPQSCNSLGFQGGFLECNDDCTYNTNGCGPALCGNGVVDPGEECDGSNHNGQECSSFGFADGGLVCGSDCRFIFDNCTSCGNGEVDPGEDCDGPGNLNGQTCPSRGYLSGDLACDPQTCLFDESDCDNAPQCTMLESQAAGPCPDECDSCIQDPNWGQTCVKMCTETMPCSGTFDCPDNYACAIDCIGTLACDGLRLECPTEDYHCDAICDGSGACHNVEMECPVGTCHMQCLDHDGVCMGATVTCLERDCSAGCAQGREGPDMDCGATPCVCSGCPPP